MPRALERLSAAARQRRRVTLARRVVVPVTAAPRRHGGARERCSAPAIARTRLLHLPVKLKQHKHLKLASLLTGHAPASSLAAAAAGGALGVRGLAALLLAVLALDLARGLVLGQRRRACDGMEWNGMEWNAME